MKTSAIVRGKFSTFLPEKLLAFGIYLNLGNIKNYNSWLKVVMALLQNSSQVPFVYLLNLLNSEDEWFNSDFCNILLLTEMILDDDQLYAGRK